MTEIILKQTQVKQTEVISNQPKNWTKENIQKTYKIKEQVLVFQNRKKNIMKENNIHKIKKKKKMSDHIFRIVNKKKIAKEGLLLILIEQKKFKNG